MPREAEGAEGRGVVPGRKPTVAGDDDQAANNRHNVWTAIIFSYVAVLRSDQCLINQNRHGRCGQTRIGWKKNGNQT